MKKSRKKYDPEKVILSPYEQEIEDSFDFSKVTAADIPTEAKLEEMAAAARRTLRRLKSERANIRFNKKDLTALRERAHKMGMPYQTLISHVLHMYVTNQFIHIEEAKKLLNLGRTAKKVG